jgi:serine phosphatase RsbU (regulator of sigma subunit)
MRARAAAEHRIVEQLQHLLLPPEWMSGEHFSATGIYRAASGDLGVGGDWYDATELPDGRVLVSVGDVVGHGVQAASVMEQLTVALSVVAPEARSAGEVLERLDDFVERTAGAFCTTVWVGLYEPATGTLSYAAAGHPPGFLLTGGAVNRLEDGRSSPLGVRLGAPRPTATARIDGPATLVLYTDGLIERPGENIDLGLGRMEAALRRAVQDPRMAPTDIVGRVAERRRRDDLVLLWVRFRGTPPARQPRSRDRRRMRRPVSG